jgi:uncharacterized protein YkwD
MLTFQLERLQVCIIVAASRAQDQSSLLETIAVTDDIAPKFMRSHQLLTSLAPLTSGSAAANAFLKAHNDYRAAHGVGPLAWDDTLAAAADTFADRCDFGHDKLRGNGIGENIYATGSSEPLSESDPNLPGKSTTSWYNEVKNWNFATSASNGGVTGHFTQVVWKATTKLGCGVASCPGMIMDNSIFVVCRYSPGGNFLCPTCDPPSTYAINVLPKN